MSRPLAAAALALMLAGCGGGGEPAAHDPGTTSASGASAPSVPSPSPIATPTEAATVTSSSAEVDGDTAEAAKALVERYYALLARGDHAAARALWRNGGAASGMDAAAFARSFAGYSGYRVTVGAPGRIEAGAGQRYVTVPVTIRGTRKDGTPFIEQGEVTLHRAGDIDGATAEQRAWRIEKVDVTPADAVAVDVPDNVTARYRCDDGTTLVALFDNRADTATLRQGGRTLGVLEGQRPASGIWYAGGGLTLRGKGEHATFVRGGGASTECSARG